MAEQPIPNYELNRIAQERFLNIRKRMSLDIVHEEIARDQVPPQVDIIKLERIFSGEAVIGPVTTTSEIERKTNEIDKIFDFIESLELPPRLSLVIGLIISYDKTKDKTELEKAIKAIESEWV